MQIELYASTPQEHVDQNNYSLSSIMRQRVFFLPRYRNAGDEWLVTSEDTEFYIPEVSEVKNFYFSYSNIVYFTPHHVLLQNELKS